MINILRQLTGFIIVGPFILSIKIMSLFMTREKAIAIMSPLIIKVAKMFVRILVPNVKNADDFDKLKDTITKRARKLRLFYDITIAEKNDNLLKLHVANCPVAEMAERLGYTDLGTTTIGVNSFLVTNFFQNKNIAFNYITIKCQDSTAC